MSIIVPSSWMPTASMSRIVFHWTAGNHHASALEKKHYHIIIEANGNLVKGNHSIKENERSGRGAGHTRNLNTKSIGVSMCCMFGSRQTPFNGGPYPMTREQYDTTAKVVADLCTFYKIPVTNKTVLGHGEVQRNLGVLQRGKWEIVVPWNPRNVYDTGDEFRELVTSYLTGAHPKPVPNSRIKVLLNGKLFPEAEAYMDQGANYVRVRPIATALGWVVDKATNLYVYVSKNGKQIKVPVILNDGVGFIAAKYLKDMGALIHWDGPNDTLRVDTGVTLLSTGLTHNNDWY